MIICQQAREMQFSLFIAKNLRKRLSKINSYQRNTNKFFKKQMNVKNVVKFKKLKENICKKRQQKQKKQYKQLSNKISKTKITIRIKSQFQIQNIIQKFIKIKLSKNKGHLEVGQGFCHKEKYLMNFQNKSEIIQKQKNFYSQSQKEKQQENTLIQGLKYCEANFSKFSIQYANALQQVSEIKKQRKQYKNCRSFLLQSFLIIGKIGKKNSQIQARIMMKIGEVSFKLNDFQEAIDFLTKSLQIYFQLRGLRNEQGLNIMYIIGECYQNLNKKSIALMYYQKAYQISSKIYETSNEKFQIIESKFEFCKQNSQKYKNEVKQSKKFLQKYQVLNQKNNCAICIQQVELFESDKQVMFLQCFHYFHKECITDWLKKQNKCPICGQQQKQEDQSSWSSEINMKQKKVKQIQMKKKETRVEAVITRNTRKKKEKVESVIPSSTLNKNYKNVAQK